VETAISELSMTVLPPGGQFCENGTFYLPNSCRVQTPTKPLAAFLSFFLSQLLLLFPSCVVPCLLLTDTNQRRRVFVKCENCEGFWKNWAYFYFIIACVQYRNAHAPLKVSSRSGLHIQHWHCTILLHSSAAHFTLNMVQKPKQQRQDG